MQRNELGCRYMDLADISSLFLITSLKHAGCSVEKIAEIIKLTEQIKASGPDWLEASTMSTLQALYRHIDELNRRQLEIIEQINITRYLIWDIDHNCSLTSKISETSYTVNDYPGIIPDIIQDTDETPEALSNDIWKAYCKKYGFSKD